MQVETIISLVALLLIVALSRIGMNFGAFSEVVSTVLLFWAMLFTLRYWYSLTHWITDWFGSGSSYATFGAYWALFLVGCTPLLALMNRVTRDSAPIYPGLFDNIVGLVFGLASAVILVCCVMTSVSALAPKVWPPYDRTALVLSLDKVPLEIYRAIERDVLRVPTNAPGHTRFPSFEKSCVDDLPEKWK
jgi:uncharacterized membrane protein required for colicin V production